MLLDDKGLTADDVENYIKTATRETPLGYSNLVKLINRLSLTVNLNQLML